MSTKPRSIFDYFNDKAEYPYLVAATNGKLDNARRTLYAKVLETRDPERAEWLRLEMQLQAEATNDENVHRRFRELSREIGYDFLRLMRRNDILNCGNGASEPRRVRFTLICEKRWETLLPTENPQERHCNDCNSRVYHATTVPEAEMHARAGHCIAVPHELVEKGSGSSFNALGRPDPVGNWSYSLFPED